MYAPGRCLTKASRRSSTAGGPELGAGQGARRAAQLAHRRGGLDAAADDVADDEPDRVLADSERVVPVAADLQRGDGGQVAAGDREARVARHVAGEQALLQRQRDPMLVLVEAGALERLAALRGARVEERAVLGLERVRRRGRHRAGCRSAFHCIASMQHGAAVAGSEPRVPSARGGRGRAERPVSASVSAMLDLGRRRATSAICATAASRHPGGVDRRREGGAQALQALGALRAARSPSRARTSSRS